MPANTSPIFLLTPNIGGGAATAANTVGDGGGTIGTDTFKVYTAGANGSYIGRCRFQLVGSASATSAASTARLFWSAVTSGSLTNTTAFCLAEVALPGSLTADNSTGANSPLEIMLGFAIPANSCLYVTNHVAPTANTRWHVTFPGSGDF